MSDINYIDIEEFRRVGYLQEANRLFFHPRGLAMEVYDPGFTDDEQLDKFLRERGVQFGRDARESIMTFIKLMKMDRPFLGGVWDYRDDPEGMVFGEFTDEMRDKVDLVELDRINHLELRLYMWGSEVQPPTEEGVEAMKRATGQDLGGEG